MKTRCIPVLVVLVTAVFASSDLAGNIVVLDDVPWRKVASSGVNVTTYAHDIDGNNVTFMRKSAKDISFFPYFDDVMQVFSCPNDW